ncbi:MAG: LrgB family protein [Tissierellia bacterium]|nr:LrgB family protein [Tissierellia bacterium]
MEFLDTPIFGLLLSILAFEVGLFINKKTKLPILNPLIIGIGLIIGFLLAFDIDYEVYNKGGSVISFFLGPATVSLAIPLYKQIEKLKENGVPVIVGILAGCIVAVGIVIYLGKIFGLDEVLILSLAPKSATAAISSEISKQIGGLPSLTVAVTVLTGITGNVLGPYICKLFKIKDEVAVGIGMGTASHAIGTAKAMELGEVQGAMSSLAISVTALLTVFIAPLLVKILL